MDASLPVRRAVIADAPEPARLRITHLLSSPVDAGWQQRLTADLEDRIAHDRHFAAFVIDAPEGRLACCALGMAYRVLPAPRYPQGLAARVHAVATEPACRGRGYAAAAVGALVDWFHGLGCTLYEVYAVDGSAGLYRRLGFEADAGCMRMTKLPAQPAAH